jgi:hypothetical protein
MLQCRAYGVLLMLASHAVWGICIIRPLLGPCSSKIEQLNIIMCMWYHSLRPSPPSPHAQAEPLLVTCASWSYAAVATQSLRNGAVCGVLEAKFWRCDFLRSWSRLCAQCQVMNASAHACAWYACALVGAICLEFGAQMGPGRPPCR